MFVHVPKDTYKFKTVYERWAIWSNSKGIVQIIIGWNQQQFFLRFVKNVGGKYHVCDKLKLGTSNM